MRLLLLLIFSATAVIAQPTIREGYPGTFALTDCRIETITNGTVDNGTVLIAEGRIEALGVEVPVPPDAEVISCDGGTVYPGFIDGGSKMGLLEIGSLSETVDIREIGTISPQMQALTAVNTASIHIPLARVNGVLSTLTTPAGGLIPGTAALISLHGHTPQHMDVGFRGIVIDFPSAARRGMFDRRSAEERERQATEQRDRLTETWDEAVLYANIQSQEPEEGVLTTYAPELEALLPAISGEIPLLIEVNQAPDILAAIEWAQERGARAIFTGVLEGWRVADQLAASRIPVITGPVHALPTRQSDRYDVPYANPGMLYAAGVTVALRTTTLASSGVQNTRNLPFHTAFAAAYGQEFGFGPQQALEAITIVPARILGVDSELGSIEAGKRATLFISHGNPLETNAELSHIFIDGYLLPTESLHSRLWDNYLDRSPSVTK